MKAKQYFDKKDEEEIFMNKSFLIDKANAQKKKVQMHNSKFIFNGQNQNSNKIKQLQVKPNKNDSHCEQASITNYFIPTLKYQQSCYKVNFNEDDEQSNFLPLTIQQNGQQLQFINNNYKKMNNVIRRYSQHRKKLLNKVGYQNNFISNQQQQKFQCCINNTGKKGNTSQIHQQEEEDMSYEQGSCKQIASKNENSELNDVDIKYKSFSQHHKLSSVAAFHQNQDNYYSIGQGETLPLIHQDTQLQKADNSVYQTIIYQPNLQEKQAYQMQTQEKKQRKLLEKINKQQQQFKILTIKHKFSINGKTMSKNQLIEQEKANFLLNKKLKQNSSNRIFLDEIKHLSESYPVNISENNKFEKKLYLNHPFDIHNSQVDSNQNHNWNNRGVISQFACETFRNFSQQDIQSQNGGELLVLNGSVILSQNPSRKNSMHNKKNKYNITNNKALKQVKNQKINLFNQQQNENQENDRLESWNVDKDKYDHIDTLSELINSKEYQHMQNDQLK